MTGFATPHIACWSFSEQEVMNVNERGQIDADKNKGVDGGRRRVVEEGL